MQNTSAVGHNARHDENRAVLQADLEKLLRLHPTPLYIYDEKGIRENARRLINAFSWNTGFRQYFAVKATPNPHIMSILKDEGCGADCSSLPELMLAERVGLSGEDIMFTSNDTPADEYVKAKAKGVQRFGLHTMVVSNERHTEYFVETVDDYFATLVE